MGTLICIGRRSIKGKLTEYDIIDDLELKVRHISLYDLSVLTQYNCGNFRISKIAKRLVGRSYGGYHNSCALNPTIYADGAVKSQKYTVYKLNSNGTINILNNDLISEEITVDKFICLFEEDKLNNVHLKQSDGIISLSGKHYLGTKSDLEVCNTSDLSHLASILEKQSKQSKQSEEQHSDCAKKSLIEYMSSGDRLTLPKSLKDSMDIKVLDILDSNINCDHTVLICKIQANNTSNKKLIALIEENDTSDTFRLQVVSDSSIGDFDTAEFKQDYYKWLKEQKFMRV